MTQPIDRNELIAHLENRHGVDWKAVLGDLGAEPATAWRNVIAVLAGVEPVDWKRGVMLLSGDDDWRKGLLTIQSWIA